MENVEVETAKGTRGSKRVSWTEKNPRELMFSIFRPSMPREELNAKMLLAVQNDFGYLPGLVEYFTAYPYSTLTTPKPPAQRAVERAAATRDVERGKTQVLQLSLDLIIGDKQLRDLTGTEASKAGGWLAKIGKKAGKKLIGDVFKTDTALRAALK